MTVFTLQMIVMITIAAVKISLQNGFFSLNIRREISCLVGTERRY